MIPTLRTATLEDAELIARLTREAWAGRVAPDSSGHFESAEKVERDLAEGGGIIMEVGGEPVGSVRWFPVFVRLEDGSRAGPVAWEIARLGLLPAYRGRGLSTWLMNEVTMRATINGIEELRLAVRDDQLQLIRWYERQGFFIDPSITYGHAYPHSKAKPVPMRKYLFTRGPSKGETV